MGAGKSLRKPRKLGGYFGSWNSTLLTLLLLMSAGGVWWWQQHFKDEEYDLSRIGNGRPVVVQVHDPTCVVCRQLQRIVDSLQGEFRADVDFLIADLSRPEGQAFANQQQVGSVTLVFFAQDGQRLGKLEGPQEPEFLRKVFGELRSSD